MHFVSYSLLASLMWSIMSIAESYFAQFNYQGALFTKFILYGLVGMILLLINFKKIKEGLHDFTKTKTKSFILLILAIIVGSLGTYFMYRAFNICGENKAIVISISYCVPVLFVVLLAYLFLGERLNLYAILGIILIVLGVLVIKIKGTTQVKVSKIK